MGVWGTIFTNDNLDINNNTFFMSGNFSWTEYYRNYDFVINYEEK